MAIGCSAGDGCAATVSYGAGEAPTAAAVFFATNAANRLRQPSSESGPGNQKVSVTWNRASRGAAIAVGRNQIAPLVTCSYVC